MVVLDPRVHQALKALTIHLVLVTEGLPQYTAPQLAVATLTVAQVQAAMRSQSVHGATLA
jgi:hypothetical protein